MAEAALVAFENRHGTAELRLHSGLLAPRIIAVDGHQARVALIATTATLLGGDHSRLQVSVGPGLRLELLEVAATVCYHGRGQRARWSAEASVEGELVWFGEPFVVAEGADVARESILRVAAGARALVREQLVLGRHGESGGRLTNRTVVEHDGSPLLVDDVVDPPRVLDTVLAAGWRPQATTPQTFLLDGAGALHRHIGDAAHSSTVPTIGAAWHRELADLPSLDQR